MDHQPPVDLAYLSRAALGDRGLEAELVELFSSQAPRLRAAILYSTDGETRSHALHTLKGSAKTIGAQKLADLSELAEKMVKVNLADPGRDAAMHAVTDELANVLAFMHEHRGQAA